MGLVDFRTSVEIGAALVSGATGFVGSALCRRLLEDGIRVVPGVRKETIFPNERITPVVVGEINETTDWSHALAGVDVVFHLAARVHVLSEMAAEPLAEFRKTNVKGTEQLARSAAAAGVRRLVYVSSIGVNGFCTEQGKKFSETDVPQPHNAYALSKWEAEQALIGIARETGLQVVIVRPPLVYGGGAPGNFAQLLSVIAKGIPLPFASVHNRRSLIYAGNLADALITCATHPAAAGQTYLVSDGEDVSTTMLVEMIARAFGRNSRTFYFPPGLLRALATLSGRGEQMDRLLGSLCVNDQKIRSELGWTPPYSMEQGLRATADWYRTQRNGYNRGTS